jgi:hypothetical protein
MLAALHRTDGKQDNAVTKVIKGNAVRAFMVFQQDTF